jgi:hypothetical protein
MMQLGYDDPWLTPWLRGPWGDWPRLQLRRASTVADQVEAKREAAQDFLRRVAPCRLGQRRMVLMENPLAGEVRESDLLEETVIDPGMDFIRGDVRLWSKRGATSGLSRSNLKPTGFAANKGALAERLSQRRRGGRERERVQGKIERDERARRSWPMALLSECAGSCRRDTSRSRPSRRRSTTLMGKAIAGLRLDLTRWLAARRGRTSRRAARSGLC